ncbi:MAG: fasciclin domain-containing protein [Ferruginibacter sp.]
MNKFKRLTLVAAIAFFSNASFAQMDKMETKEKDGKMKMKMKKQKTVMVGGAAMYPSKNIVENAVNSADHTTLVAAVKAAGLVETLQSAGPFTVFAPTNAAFNLLPAGTVDNLVKPENKGTLTTILTYHVVAGKFNASDIAKLIKAGNGTATIKTVAGNNLYASMKGKNLLLKDESGNTAMVTIRDVNQSNGVIHVIDHVLLPKM